MKKALLIALTLVISVAFVTVVFAQAPAPGSAPEKAAPAPEKVKKAPAAKGSVKEETPTSAMEKKMDTGKGPKAPKGGVKEESTAAGESKKADKGKAPKAPKGGVKEESAAPVK